VRLLILIAALLLALAPAAGAQEPKTTLPDVEDEVMCIACGTALNVSEAPSADREREFIRRRIAEGLTKEQIKDRLVAEYGQNVLATPPAKGKDLAAWVVPFALAGLALLAVGLTMRRWKRSGGGDDDDPDGGLSDEDAERLERDMAGYDL
jgi:cytochrome c-type biogenesis protein CcmH/NrfF